MRGELSVLQRDSEADAGLRRDSLRSLFVDLGLLAGALFGQQAHCVVVRLRRGVLGNGPLAVDGHQRTGGDQTERSNGAHAGDDAALDGWSRGDQEAAEEEDATGDDEDHRPAALVDPQHDARERVDHHTQAGRGQDGELHRVQHALAQIRVVLRVCRGSLTPRLDHPLDRCGQYDNDAGLEDDRLRRCTNRDCAYTNCGDHRPHAVPGGRLSGSRFPGVVLRHRRHVAVAGVVVDAEHEGEGGRRARPAPERRANPRRPTATVRTRWRRRSTAQSLRERVWIRW